MASISKGRKITSSTVKYIDSRFICGSNAEVERLWSVAKHILQNNCKSIFPMLLETLLLLKVNKAYWDISVVHEAMSKESTESVADVLEDEEQL